MMIYKPNFERAYIMANNILVSSNVLEEFPVKVKKIVEDDSSVKCCSYKKARKYEGLNLENFGSKSAVLIEQDGRKIIFYNESELKERIRFSILHEYGHYKLSHNLDTKDKEEYKTYELETNYFAAQLLMPEQLIREIQARGIRVTNKLLIDLFGVSNEAAERRVNTLGKNLKLSNEEKLFDDIIVNKYTDWINKKVPFRNSMNLFLDDFERQKEREKWLY